MWLWGWSVHEGFKIIRGNQIIHECKNVHEMKKMFIEVKYGFYVLTTSVPNTQNIS